MHFLFALCLLHFLPTVIAAIRHSRSTLGIFFVNLFLGWTVIGWVVALIWAISSEPRYPYAYPAPRRYY